MGTANQANLPDLNLSKELQYPETIQQVQPRYIVGVDWGTRFPVYAFGSNCVFHPIMPPNVSVAVFKYFKTEIKHYRKRGRKREVALYERAYSDYIIRYATAYASYLVGICYPNGVIAVEDQPCFDLLDYNVYNNEFTEEMHIREIYIALTTMAKISKNIDVIRVPNRQTSIRCPVCGYTAKKNRNHGSHKFECCHCGTWGNDDAVAAWNVHNLGYYITNGTDFPYNNNVTGFSETTENIQYYLENYMRYLESRDSILPDRIKRINE